MSRKTVRELLGDIERLESKNSQLRKQLADQNKLRTEGRIDAFEFAANQFEVYADDNDAIHRRYGTKGGKALAVAQKRSQTFRDCAADLRRYAEEQKRDLA